jgi:hypothetical protein
VILFVGDGMGLATITASRILRGQREGRPGEETRLAWEHFPAVALARVSAMFITRMVSPSSWSCDGSNGIAIINRLMAGFFSWQEKLSSSSVQNIKAWPLVYPVSI